MAEAWYADRWWPAHIDRAFSGPQPNRVAAESSIMRERLTDRGLGCRYTVRKAKPGEKPRREERK